MKIDKDLNEISFGYTIKPYNKNEVNRIERNMSAVFPYSIKKPDVFESNNRFFPIISFWKEQSNARVYAINFSFSSNVNIHC